MVIGLGCATVYGTYAQVRALLRLRFVCETVMCRVPRAQIAQCLPKHGMCSSRSRCVGSLGCAGATHAPACLLWVAVGLCWLQTVSLFPKKYHPFFFVGTYRYVRRHQIPHMTQTAPPPLTMCTLSQARAGGTVVRVYAASRGP